ncbi:hypothetical protein [Streptomyces sp. NPDC048277]|uniref:hypothetical protein n=1 Tax=Streptomyces sp. NPDC048277 TaxID=3155027 RepID=UPI0033E258E0
MKLKYTAGRQALQHSATIRTLFVKGAYYYNVDPQAFSGGSGGNPAATVKYLKYARSTRAT